MWLVVSSVEPFFLSIFSFSGQGFKEELSSANAGEPLVFLCIYNGIMYPNAKSFIVFTSACIHYENMSNTVSTEQIKNQLVIISA